MSKSMHTILLLTVGFQCLTTHCVELTEKEWWETTLVYQIWPRGFQDSDGDGEGDLKGVISRLDYIKQLGIDTIWLNPIYSSPLIDAGYDVSNYTDIHPMFGSLNDFDVLVAEAHDRDLKVILDIVPNHSSNEHEWFQLSSRNIDPYTDYYIWSNGSVDDYGNNIPPNNWVSMYSDEAGSAWTWHTNRKQWYYHKFHSSQPDLNLRNEKVIQELMDILDFWLQKSVDGFRINAVPYFFEDEDLQDEPTAGNGTYTFGLLENTALLYEFRSYVDDWVETNNSTSKLLIAESYDSNNNLMAYYGNGTHEGIPPFNFRFITHINNGTDADSIKTILEEWFQLLPENTSTNWVLSNHDTSRAASRIGLNRTDGFHMLSLLLPGQAYTYYGEEIAMLDTEVLWNETIDPMGSAETENTYKEFSRDRARTPMQWNADTSAGFSVNENTYLPVHPNYLERNVESQENQERSNIKTYRTLAALRKDVVFTHGDYDFATLNDNHIFVLSRFLEDHPMYLVVVNLGLQQEIVNLTSLYPDLGNTLEVVVASVNAINITKTVPSDNIVLIANAAFVLVSNKTKETNTTEPHTESTTEAMEETTTVEHISETSTEESTTETWKTTTEIPEESTTEMKETTMKIATETPSTVLPIETTSFLITTEAGNNSQKNIAPMIQLIVITLLTVIAVFRKF